MNKILTLSALAVSMASTAIAGSATPSATDVAIMAPAPLGATDWSGLYFGASAGVANGNLENILLVNDDLDNNSLFGAFAGYNQQRGNLVFGGEVEFTLTPIEFVNFTTIMENNIDLKGRVGYAFGDALVYGVAGYSLTTLNDDPALAPLSGISIGAGLDYKIGDRYFAGAEYLARNVSGAFDNNPLNTFTDQLISTVKLRVGVSF